MFFLKDLLEPRVWVVFAVPAGWQLALRLHLVLGHSFHDFEENNYFLQKGFLRTRDEEY